MRISRLLVSAFLIPGIFSAEAQISYGGLAFGLMERGPHIDPAPVVQLPAVDAEALLAEDELRMASGIPAPFRFGFNHTVQIGMDQGTWTEFENGDRLWRLTLHCPDAFSIGLVFSRYVVPEGALVFLYNERGVQRGAFMAASNGRTTMAVDQLQGERITVEYFEPNTVRDLGVLEIGQVTHGYRDQLSSRDFGDSGACQVNVICPEGDAWRDQIRSVVRINTGGSSCTGTLVTNCLSDGTPYILTAKHCLGSSVANWVFVFNWDSPDCDPTTFVDQTQSISGAELLADHLPTDMAFLRLGDVPPDDYEVFYSGWDNSGAVSQQATGIHHPMGDIKKISRSFDPIYQETATVGGTDHEAWRVGMFAEGLTESGSSGSGLWGENGLLVGQLIGGFGTCGDTNTAAYGRFDLSYPIIEQWLGNCGAQVPGIDFTEVVVPIYFDGAVTSITNIPALLCGDSLIQPQITLKNNGINVVTSILVDYGIQGMALNNVVWTGSLLPGQTYNYMLPPIAIPPGDHTLVAFTHSPNGNMDQVPENDQWSVPITASWPSENVLLQITQDSYGSDITWNLMSPTGVELFSGGPYQNGNNEEMIEVPMCLSNGCYTFTIEDVFGDGICCDSGEGNYMIQTATGHVFVMNNGEYGDGNTDVFCLEAVNVAEIELLDAIELYPNPTNGQLNLHSAIALDQVTLIDGVGRIISERDLSGFHRNVTIDLSSLAEGVYLLEVMANGQRAVKRVVVQR